jgi:NADP-dependent 3-hydroxy acid dehydrogenase YdfG
LKEIWSHHQYWLYCCKEVYPNGNVYCASKHAVDALNQGMRIDLNPFRVEPFTGMVETEFRGALQRDTNRAENV